MREDLHSVMIVDDEVLALDHTADLVDWTSLGCRLVARASGPREAIKLFARKKPTIVIADISMPEMSGIEMMREILCAGIPVKFVFLTAYREFSFIQEAMRMGASGFILKHELSPELLAKELQKAASGLAAELHHGQKPDEPAHADGQARNRLAAVVEPDSPFPVVGAERPVLYAPPVEQIRRIDYTAWQYIDYVQLDEMRRNRSILVIKTRPVYSQLAFWEELRRFYRHIQSIYESAAGCTVSMAVSMRSIALPMVEAETEALHRLLDSRFFAGRGQLLFAENMAALPASAAPASGVLQQFAQEVKRGAFQAQALEGMFASAGTLPVFTTLVRGLAAEMDRIRQDLGLPNLDEMLARGVLDTSLWCDAAGVRTWFAREFAALAEKSAQKTAARSSMAAQGLAMIRQRYRDDINLEMIAGEIGISAVYLLKLLKRETGKTFTELLTQQRMEQAAVLILQSKTKTREVATAVGYHSGQYFGTVFKKYYGCTPQGYLKNHGRGPGKRKNG